mmetsp:Transcript_90/g.240  ORF Transcript_90/g.240 Transcript_90/m.240 type:complete len:211 (-) Transcript_90:321-953(-)
MQTDGCAWKHVRREGLGTSNSQLQASLSKANPRLRRVPCTRRTDVESRQARASSELVARPTRRVAAEARFAGEHGIALRYARSELGAAGIREEVHRERRQTGSRLPLFLVVGSDNGEMVEIVQVVGEKVEHVPPGVGLVEVHSRVEDVIGDVGSGRKELVEHGEQVYDGLPVQVAENSFDTDERRTRAVETGVAQSVKDSCRVAHVGSDL